MTFVVRFFGTSLLLSMLAACTHMERAPMIKLEKENTNSYNFNSKTQDATDVAYPPLQDEKRFERAYLGELELKRLFSERTIVGGYMRQEGEWAEYYGKNGQAYFTYDYDQVSKGRWWLTDRQACFEYEDEKAQHCFYVKSDQGRYVFVKASGIEEFFVKSMKRGDTFDLRYNYDNADRR